ISEEEIFGQRTKRRKRRSAAANEFVTDLKDLTAGDFVVHVDFGVGQYLGLTKLAVNGVDSDYLSIEYKGKDKLYLPVHRLRLISKYANTGEGRQPALDKLGGTAWANTKRKVKDTLLKMAAELIRLYAVRQTVEGQALPAPDEVFRQFEAEFPFDPTPDQAKAIEDVVEDMQKAVPMDRLICGDVGYGKTEVAMRAAMMAVMGGRQVVLLVPTTVLAAQHYQTFSDRFANYPVKIALVSRFQTKDQTKQALKDAKENKIDILIGTHRLLSKDVTFKQLGLLIIDEEHRFGVRHKEAVKKYRATVHVLALSATPIPRTLHMGFMGVRDMSMIATAPVDRLAVKTEVHRFSEDVVREVILREIRRGGQCFVVHNRVSSIGAFAKMLERLVPEARVGIGHGQMEEDRLEQVMVDFMNKKFNVLLATTIIESGIDIPNANTILINRADRMGLAQL
ncbi:MAG: DEAD/DEAH box helicase, partial [Myxococcota bacterium]